MTDSTAEEFERHAQESNEVLYDLLKRTTWASNMWMFILGISTMIVTLNATADFKFHYSTIHFAKMAIWFPLALIALWRILTWHRLAATIRAVLMRRLMRQALQLMPLLQQARDASARTREALRRLENPTSDDDPAALARDAHQLVDEMDAISDRMEHLTREKGTSDDHHR